MCGAFPVDLLRARRLAAVLDAAETTTGPEVSGALDTRLGTSDRKGYATECGSAGRALASVLALIVGRAKVSAKGHEHARTTRSTCTCVAVSS